ncbi:uncharacterized protein [Amphiura filiformis]|uniref:uncharacterized protein n=1 Tax=Amphiura filiformis TaxID=82378 RepID=UPI003B20DD77
MTAQEQSSSGVPQFLTKLWLLVDDSSTDHLIRWGQEGDSFLVIDQPCFAKEVLPQFFKHNNMASFVRQLNMYGFRKKTNIDQGALKSVREDVEFVHPHFKKGQTAQLELIKRKVSAGKEDPKVKHEEVNKILSDVKGMKMKQQDINGTLEAMKRENQALWGEVMMLRQRHDKQQKIVNRLIQFLLTLVNPVGMKRKQPLAIEASDGSSSGPSRPPKYGKQISLHSSLDDLISMQAGANVDSLQGARLSDITDSTSGGATVSEVTSPLEPTGGALPGQSQLQPQTATNQSGLNVGLSSAPATSATSTAPNSYVPAPQLQPSAATVDGSGDQSIATMPVSQLLTPMTLTMVPELGDIATMPISEILAPSTLPSSMAVSSDPIITSPLSVSAPLSQDGFGVTTTLSDPTANVTVSKPPTSLELIPKATDGSQPHHSGILQRALSTEEIEQKEILGTELNALQANIESIQSLLTNPNPSLTIDPDVLLGVFTHGGDDHGDSNLGLFGLSDPYGEFNPANIAGTEMIEYNTDASLQAAAAAAIAEASDDDSLLESLNEDSRALASARSNRFVQEEID